MPAWFQLGQQCFKSRKKSIIFVVGVLGQLGKFRRDDGNPATMLQSLFGKYWRSNGLTFGLQKIVLRETGAASAT